MNKEPKAKHMGTNQQAISIDDAILTVGEFGAGQRVQVCVAGLAWSISAFHTVLVFISTLGQDPTKSHLVECVKAGDQVCQKALAKPYPALCTLQRDQWKWKSQGYSLVSEFDLICDKTWLLYFTAAIFFLGIFLGSIAWQLLNERYSRRRLLYSSCIVAGIAGIMAATAPSLWIYTLFRLVTGVGVGGMAVSSYILSTDVVGPTWRGTVSLALHAFFSLGGLAATLLAMVVPGWRWMAVISSLVSLLYVATWSLVTESPQWLLLKGKKGEATAAIAAIAFSNKTRPPERPLADATALENPNRGFADVMRNTRLRRISLVVSMIWAVASLVYFAIIMLSSSLSSGDLGGTTDGSTLEILMTGFAYEVPAVAAAALAVEKLGRKNTAAAGFLQAAACCLAAAFLQEDAQRAFVVASRFGLAAALSSLYLHTTELYPVVVQHVGLGIGNYAARLGSVAAPALPLLAALLHGNRVTLLVCGCLAGGAIALALMLPETSGMPAYETIQDMSSAFAVKRHRSWSSSLRSVFRPTGGAGASPGDSSSVRQGGNVVGVFAVAGERNV